MTTSVRQAIDNSILFPATSIPSSTGSVDGRATTFSWQGRRARGGAGGENTIIASGYSHWQ